MSRSFSSYAYEGMVIVASILIAFALDASWANYQDAKLEQRVLGELRAEFRSAETRIVKSIEELDNVISATMELGDTLGPEATPLSLDEAAGLLRRMTSMNTLEVPSSVLDSIIATGQLRLIGDNELRAALSEWPALVADVRENHEWHRVGTDEFLVPFLSAHVPVRDALSSEETECCGSSRFVFDPTGLQRDPVFEGRLFLRASRQLATRAESETLLLATRSVVELIEDELR